jgi:hypothetical protein
MPNENAEVSECLLASLVVAFFAVVFFMLVVSSGYVAVFLKNFDSIFGGM